MEQIACIVGGMLLIACAYGLTRLKPPDWFAGGGEESKTLLRWSAVQRGVRNVNNAMLAVVGVAIVSTAFIQQMPIKLVVWSGVLVLLMISIVLAMADAVSSLMGYRRALPEAARKSLSKDSRLLANADSQD